MQLSDDGLIFTLARKGEVIPAINKEDPILNDFIVIMDLDGNELNKFSILDRFLHSRYRPLLLRMAQSGDVFHTNTIELLDGRLAPENPAFRRGNLLISIRRLDTIAVIDPDQKKVVWALDGMWSRQHQPTVLDNGNMLIFDNRGNRGVSRVLEFDAFTQQVTWRYGERPGERLYSKTCGTCQRLPNGNTLITESDNGRALEVTVDGTIVWEFRNPHRAGDDEELIATLFEVVRLPVDFPTNW